MVKQTSNLPITMLGIYGPPAWDRRVEFFHELSTLPVDFLAPLIMGGDFNVTRNTTERKNCKGHSGDSRVFSQLIVDLDLLDLPIAGLDYTWTNNQAQPALAKLDQILLGSQLGGIYGPLYQDGPSLSKPILIEQPLFRVDWPKIYSLDGQNLQHITCPFSLDEVKGVVFELKNHKSLGPDGIQNESFKTFWNDLGSILTRLFNDILEKSDLIKRINNAFIVLIPKKYGACRLEDFRPIGLEGSLIKKFSKLLANRLATLMPSLIDYTQGAFTSGRSSLDCYMTVNEKIWSCKAGNENMCFINVYFAKAFDSIGHGFLLDLLEASGFPNSWISRIAHLLSSALSSIINNGSIGQSFGHKRGLRQGNPLSPLLFNIIMDSLSKLIQRACHLGFIKGALSNSIEGGISHIAFADDLVIFYLFILSDNPLSTVAEAKDLDEENGIRGWNIGFTNQVPLGRIEALTQHLSPFLYGLGPDSFKWKWTTGASKGRLLTKDRLIKWNVQVDETCVLCHTLDESHAHLFHGCTFIITGWRKMLELCDTPLFNLNYKPWCRHNIKPSKKIKEKLGAVMIWKSIMWKERNSRTFRNEEKSVVELAFEGANLFLLCKNLYSP
ncbi:hypothetical protein Cni_G29101 [Canna indica]|uniref:Reverse transcriptase domain-containing protein n=1 Tax=Canna indica TaxID=4628 RepID=A0AAQ3LAZ9_9LILI|nr:hypothetical protein Cni_G29101 [Canna indica]